MWRGWFTPSSQSPRQKFSLDNYYTPCVYRYTSGSAFGRCSCSVFLDYTTASARCRRASDRTLHFSASGMQRAYAVRSGRPASLRVAVPNHSQGLVSTSATSSPCMHSFPVGAVISPTLTTASSFGNLISNQQSISLAWLSCKNVLEASQMPLVSIARLIFPLRGGCSPVGESRFVPGQA